MCRVLFYRRGAMKNKKRQNKKGFSLVELIVVLVIMAILMAVVVGSMTGYIRQSRELRAQGYLGECLQAAQEITSNAYAQPSHVYDGETGDIDFGSDFTLTEAEEAKLYAEILEVSEMEGTVSDYAQENGVVTHLEFVSKINKEHAVYDHGVYSTEED